MKRWYFKIYQNGEEDGDNIWQDANTKQEAIDAIRSEYWGIDDLLLLSSKEL